MFSPMHLMAIILLYMSMLVAFAVWADRKSGLGRRIAGKGYVYALSLAVYCSSWTYFGSIGTAANSGFIYLAIYLGPTLALIFGWHFISRLISIKKQHNITSIADFAAFRFGNSRRIAALITLIAVVGIAPYIALQIKSLISTFNLIADSNTAANDWVNLHFGPIVVIFMILFTILFGMRKLDSSEQHPGLVMAIAIESVVKLFTFLLIGVFVTFFMFDGFRDIFAKFTQTEFSALWTSQNSSGDYALKWITYTILSMSAILFLPRQFHITVIENSNRNHLRTALWILPLYLLLFCVFTAPIAMGGLLSGLPIGQAESYLMILPIEAGKPLLAILVFIGGFSAATGMVIISSITLTTMITNHVIYPIVDRFGRLKFIGRILLPLRWLTAACVIALGYAFEYLIGESYALVNMGIISFTAAIQFAPAIIGGLFWRKASKSGAFWGLSAGAVLWAYTLLLPAFIKSGWLPQGFLDNGMLGISLLRPEQLFGLTRLDPIIHGTFWSLAANIICFAIFSIRNPDNESSNVHKKLSEDRTQNELEIRSANSRVIEAGPKIEFFRSQLNKYLDPVKSDYLLNSSLDARNIRGLEMISVSDLMHLQGSLEKGLGGIVGTVAAHHILNIEQILLEEEKRQLKQAYGQMLADMNISPDEFRRKIDFYRERESMIRAQADDLERMVAQKTQALEKSKALLEDEIHERKAIEEALRESEQKFRAITDCAKDAIAMLDSRGRVVLWNPAGYKIFGYAESEAIGMTLESFLQFKDEFSLFDSDHDDDSAIHDIHGLYQLMAIKKNGASFPVEVALSTIEYKDQAHIVAIIRDISEQENTRQQLLQSEKLAAIGTLAAGVAHEINNPVGYVKSNLTTMSKYLKKISETLKSAIDNKAIEDEMLADILEDFEDAIQESIEGTHKVEQIVADLKSFSRVDRAEEELTDINTGIESTLNVVWNEIKYKAEVEKELGDIPKILCRPNQLNQVFMNILVNAAHAIEADKGEIRIRTWSDNSSINISIRDNGVGIPVESQKKIFEPFYTTKDVGKGTGLGLSLSYDIVRKHGGNISVRSKPGEGSEFIIQLPLGDSHREESSRGDILKPSTRMPAT